METVMGSIGLAVGAIVTVFAARWQLRRSSADLKSQTDALGTVSDAIRTAVDEFQLEAKKEFAELGRHNADLQKTSTTIRAQVDSFKTEAANNFVRIETLSREIGNQVINIQEVTRRLLADFPEIFMRAEKMLRESAERFWYLNFTPCFGRVHCWNAAYLSRYFALHEGRDASSIDEAFHLLNRNVTEFEEDLEKKAKTLSDFRLACHDGGDFLAGFIDPVLTKTKDNLFYGQMCVDKKTREEISENIAADHEASLRNLSTKIQKRIQENKHIVPVQVLSKIPLQIIVSDGGRDGNERCLVFFIGSDNVALEEKVRGFYTEYPYLVRLFKEIFESIVKHHAKPLSE